MKRWKDFSATRWRVEVPPSAISGAAITTAIVTAISPTSGKSISVQTISTVTTEMPARSPCSTEGHCAPSRCRQPGAVAGGSACQSCRTLAVTIAQDTPTATSIVRSQAIWKARVGSFRLIRSTRLEVMAMKSQANPCGLTCMAMTPAIVAQPRNRQSATWS